MSIFRGAQGGASFLKSAPHASPIDTTRRHWHHLAASAQRGGIGTARRHRVAQKPQCPSSKRCQSRQTVSIRLEVTGFRRRHHTQSTKQHLTNPTQPEIPASHATNFSTMRVCNDSSTCFQPENTQLSPPPHTVHYEHTTAARDLELSRELLQKLPSQGTTALTPRCLRPLAIRPQPSEALGNLGINCAGTHYCVSPAKRSNTAHRWQLCASTPRSARLDREPKR